MPAGGNRGAWPRAHLLPSRAFPQANAISRCMPSGRWRETVRALSAELRGARPGWQPEHTVARGRCASPALSPLPLIFSKKSEKSLCGTGAQGNWLALTVPAGVVFDVLEVQTIDERLARPTLQWGRSAEGPWVTLPSSTCSSQYSLPLCVCPSVPLCVSLCVSLCGPLCASVPLCAPLWLSVSLCVRPSVCVSLSYLYVGRGR